MSRVHVVGGLLAGCLLLCLIGPAQAQAPYWPYLPRPTDPSLRPYQHLFRPHGGSLGYSLRSTGVQRELRQAIGRQTAALERQEAGVRELRRQVSQMMPRAPIRPTGAGSVFMSYSHYYSGLGSGGYSAGGRGGPRAGSLGGRSSLLGPRPRSY